MISLEFWGLFLESESPTWTGVLKRDLKHTKEITFRFQLRMFSILGHDQLLVASVT
jgi:hypothetical protein